MSNTRNIEEFLKMTGQRFYEVNGQTIFPRYGANGSITTVLCAFPIKREGPKWYASCVTLSLADVESANFATIKERVEQAQKKYEEFDPTGGALPYHAMEK